MIYAYLLDDKKTIASVADPVFIPEGYSYQAIEGNWPSELKLNGDAIEIDTAAEFNKPIYKQIRMVLSELQSSDVSMPRALEDLIKATTTYSPSASQSALITHKEELRAQLASLQSQLK